MLLLKADDDRSEGFFQFSFQLSVWLGRKYPIIKAWSLSFKPLILDAKP